MTRPARAGLVALVVTAGLAGCSSTPQAPPAPAPPVVTASSFPAAADGTRLDSCGTGTCEVEIQAGQQIPVPADSGVSTLRAESVEKARVSFTGRVSGNRTGGYCAGAGECDSSGSDGTFDLTLGPGVTGSQNDVAITLIATDGTRAVVRLTPA